MTEATKRLRFTFVQMLFALAIGRVAVEIGEFYKLNSTFYFSNFHVLAHFVLATYILTSSWIGWQNSNSPGNAKEIISVFDLQFLILLVDVFLVICYFIIIQGVEHQANNYKPDARVEAYWTFVIFVTYLFWDILTKLLSSNTDEKTRRLKFTWDIFIKRARITIICVALSGGVLFFMSDVDTKVGVVMVDIILLMLYVLFRGYKNNLVKIIEGINQGVLYYFKFYASRVLPIFFIIICVIIYFFAEIIKCIK